MSPVRHPARIGSPSDGMSTSGACQAQVRPAFFILNMQTSARRDEQRLVFQGLQQSRLRSPRWALSYRLIRNSSYILKNRIPVQLSLCLSHSGLYD